MTGKSEVGLIRPLKDTRQYRKGQRCWVKFTTGSLAVCVVGKYRGKGRYVTAWLHDPKQCDMSKIARFTVNAEFAERLGIA